MEMLADGGNMNYNDITIGSKIGRNRYGNDT